MHKAILVEGNQIIDEHPRQFQSALIGGEPLGPRHMLWNFVSSRAERVEQAKEDWKAGRFPVVPGDEKEFIPFPG